MLARGADEPFTLSEQQENELLAAVEEIERGDFVALDELLESLRKYGEVAARGEVQLALR